MKRAADTNLLVRLVTRDEPWQLDRVLMLLAEGPLMVLPTVLLETEWVLRSAFNYSREATGASLTSLLALPGLDFIERDRIVDAVLLHQGGMDFADALHLTHAAECDEIVTFDRKFARAAASLGVVPTSVRLLRPSTSQDPLGRA
jgi:predicted nucleic-acid-binding protein